MIDHCQSVCSYTQSHVVIWSDNGAQHGESLLAVSDRYRAALQRRKQHLHSLHGLHVGMLDMTEQLAIAFLLQDCESLPIY